MLNKSYLFFGRSIWPTFLTNINLLAKKVKFLAFSGLAISSDLEMFNRVSDVPILDRTDLGLFINAIHSVVAVENGLG